MRKLTVVAVLGIVGLWVASGVAFSDEWKGKSETKTAGSYQVEFITPTDGLKIGDNTVAVLLKDAQSGQAVVRTSVKVDFLMDEGDTSMNHGGMSSQKPVVVDLKAVSGVPGRYEGKANLGYSGDWKARVYADPKGIQPAASFKVNVGAAGPNFAVIGIIVAAIAVVVVGVAVMMRKSASSQTSTTAAEASKA